MKPFTAPMPPPAAVQAQSAGLGAAQDEPARTSSWLLPPEPSSVREARRLARTQLTHWALHEQIDDTELLVSELVTNALRHAWGPIRLTFSLTSQDGGLRCEIEDANPAGPLRRQAREHDEAGRGMHLLSLLSRCWGSHRTRAGKVVWFELHVCAGPA